jgi:hypothetical protein
MESDKRLNRLNALAKEKGCTVITPPVLKGRSGVSHEFSFLASKGDKFYGVDVLKSIGQIDAMKARIKQYDTSAFCYAISTTGKLDADVKKSVSSFGLGLFGADEVEELVDALKAVI